MSNVVNINDLKDQYKAASKVKDLKEIAEVQHALIEKLQAEIAVLKQKTVSKPSVLRISSEEQICMEQIEILKNRSRDRELSLDEVKRLDILIKNLRLIREQATQVINTTEMSEFEEDALVAIASNTSED
jgi:predicted nucleotidyltransferase component of viral defense system